MRIFYRQSMLFTRIMLSVLLCGGFATSQITVSGTISDTKGQPLAGAQVKLVTLNQTVTTNAQGFYSFGGSPVSEPQRFSRMNLKGKVLTFDLLAPVKISISTYNVAGSLTGRLYSRQHGTGIFEFDLESSGAKEIFSQAPSFGLLKISLGHKSYSLVYSHVGKLVLGRLPESIGRVNARGLAKNSAEWDDIEVSIAGYVTRRAEVVSASAKVNLFLARDYKDYLAAGNKPNILLIYSDQHLGAGMAWRGHPDVITPHMDKLAEEGVAFTRMYVQNNICASSRQSIMTGQYPRTIGQMTNSDKADIQQSLTPLALVLQQNGYYTYSTGKRHLLPDGSTPNHKWIDRGWDKSEGGIYREEPDGDSYVEWLMQAGEDPNRPDTNYLMAYAIDWASTSGQGPSGPSNCDYCGDKFTGERADLATRTSVSHEDYTVDAFSKNNAIREIRNRDKSKPFFIWTSYMKPHQPYTPQQKYLDIYEAAVPGYASAWGTGLKNGGTIKKPSNLEENIDNLPPSIRNRRTGTNPIWNGGTAALDHQIYRDYIAAYYALTTEVDAYIGEFMDVLEEEGISDSTIVIYTSDHGEFAGRHGIPEKSSAGQVVYEETLNVPFIVKWPCFVTNDYTPTSLAQQIDLFPTLMELTGLSKDGVDPSDNKPLAGKSLVATLTQGIPTETEFAVAENWKARTIITETHKLTRWWSESETIQSTVNFNDMLFDRSEFEPDEGPALPSETINHIDNANYATVKADLESKLAAWEASTDGTGRTQLLNQ